MSSKIWLALGLVAAAIVAFFIIKKEGSTPEAVISILGEDSSNLKAYRSLETAFVEATHVRPLFEADTFESAMQKADADFKGGTAQYDIVLQYNFSLSPYVRNKYVIDIGETFSPKLLASLQALNEDIFPNALRETCFYYSNPDDLQSSPKQFGFPFAANTMLLVHNKRLFEDPTLLKAFKDKTGKDLRVPTEWADYLEAAEFFAAQPGTFGVCIQGAEGSWLYYELCNYLFSMGTGTSRKQYGWEEEKPLTVSSPENVKVMEYYKRLQSVSSGNFFTVDAPKQREIMLQGKTAMAIMWSDYIPDLLVEATKQKLSFGFAPIPGKLSGLAGGAFYINRRSHHAEAAARFILFALQPTNQRRLIENGLCSPMMSAYSDDVLARAPQARALRDSLDRGVFMFEAGADADFISTALTTYSQKYIRGDVDAAQALAEAAKEITTKRLKSK